MLIPSYEMGVAGASGGPPASLPCRHSVLINSQQRANTTMAPSLHFERIGMPHSTEQEKPKQPRVLYAA